MRTHKKTHKTTQASTDTHIYIYIQTRTHTQNVYPLPVISRVLTTIETTLTDCTGLNYASGNIIANRCDRIF